jgi:late competence protein required for DNA uptake (superfamily II DNA/RNA helicase)
MRRMKKALREGTRITWARPTVVVRVEYRQRLKDDFSRPFDMKPSPPRNS